jgi:hypothetical protein
MDEFKIYPNAAEALGKKGEASDGDVDVVERVLNLHEQLTERYATKPTQGITPPDIVLLRIAVREALTAALEKARLASPPDMQAVSRRMQECNRVLKRWVDAKGSLAEADTRPLKWIPGYLKNLGSLEPHDVAPYIRPLGLADMYYGAVADC